MSVMIENSNDVQLKRRTLLQELDQAEKACQEIADELASLLGGAVISKEIKPVGFKKEQPKSNKTGKRGPGRPSQSDEVAKTPKAAAKNAAKNAGDASQDTVCKTCREAVWHALSMVPKQWSEYLGELAGDKNGLQLADLRNVIVEGNLWNSPTGNVSQQIQQHVYKLKKAGKIIRGEDRCYSIVKGAELNGPDLDSSGKPVA